MSDRKKELADKNQAFDLIGTRIPCPYYRRAPFGFMRCMGSNLAGKCGHPHMICPIPVPGKSVKLSDIIEVD